ncbi:MAG: RHS repeat domain-containing protein [Steroidobacteraceae bacterium]
MNNALGQRIRKTTVAVSVRPASGGGVKAWYVHADQLGTPRRVSEPDTNAVVWKWDSDPYGEASEQEDPDGDSVLFAYGLRFPGQYYDAESQLHYKYFRDYEPAIGRYVESDPIGLKGGINTYAYAYDSPINHIDPFGLWVKICARWLGNEKSRSTTRLNPTRHDYLDVSGQSLGFYADGNPAWGPGVVRYGNEADRTGCKLICGDDKFDAYVLAAAREIGAPTYCAIASAEFGLSGIATEAAGARNCQSWARDVLAKAKQKYLAQESCPTCFKE